MSDNKDNVASTIRFALASAVAEIYDDPFDVYASDLELWVQALEVFGIDFWDREKISTLAGRQCTDFEEKRLRSIMMKSDQRADSVESSRGGEVMALVQVRLRLCPTDQKPTDVDAVFAHLPRRGEQVSYGDSMYVVVEVLWPDSDPNSPAPLGVPFLICHSPDRPAALAARGF